MVHYKLPPDEGRTTNLVLEESMFSRLIDSKTYWTCSFAFLMVVIAGLSTTAVAQNWPSFRGTNATGFVEGKPTPTTWDATKGTNVLWKTPIPGLAHASPVVWGDRVFVTTAVSSKGGEYFRHGLFGDVDPSVAHVAGRLTPVPGGVGPTTIALLLENAVRASRFRSGEVAFPF